MRKSGKIGMGVIGCGSISWLCHFPSIKAIPELELVAVCDSNEEYARKAAEKWGAKKWYTDYRKMVENKDLNAVVIASANSVHCEQTIAAARAGLHVYVEKPMAVTNKEAWEMVRVCRENNVKLTVGTNQRFWLQHEWAKKLIDDGVIGEVKFGRSSLHETWHLYQDNVAYSDWRLKPKQAGSATLFDQGSHRVDLLRWLVGSEAKRVVGVAKRVATPEDVCSLDDLSWVAIEFENGAYGFVTTDKFSPVVSNITEIYATEGMLFTSSEATNPFQSVPLAVYTAKDYTWENYPEILKKYRYPEEFWVTDLITRPLEKKWISITPPREWSFTRMMKHFLTCFVEDKEPLVTGEDGAKVMEILCAVFKSMETNSWVDLPLKEEVVPPHYRPYYEKKKEAK
ncbi:gfo/Idh/MocA family oxidoreductase [Candidatus Aerophobetes bacterium]|uniref:Gfo/Idh/MocA family oxidoreductase n=1 Tax=Aerophobetes bacterium TaxID=2030807 RepID=A0A662DB57_UNCAE|nr:MAG: gfo/Idh/MocA family oxidoreductase [Candidatus Aerophobetes bacterium]